MAAARKEEQERIEEERVQAVRELTGDYQVDLVAHTRIRRYMKKERRSKEAEKTKANERGTGKPVFPQATAGDQEQESDALIFSRWLRKSVQSAKEYLASVRERRITRARLATLKVEGEGDSGPAALEGADSSAASAGLGSTCSKTVTNGSGSRRSCGRRGGGTLVGGKPFQDTRFVRREAVHPGNIGLFEDNEGGKEDG
jgi:hypothetical protein